MLKTPNYNLNKPEGTDVVDIAVLNENADIVDATLKAKADLVSGKVPDKRTARFTVGTSAAGWTAADCDYLCDGTADQTEINAAITALPATGGEIVILDGTYNITAKIVVTKNNISIRGNGNATILKRMFNSSVAEGVITLTGRSGCKIANLQIEGNKTSYTNTNNCGVTLNSSSNNTVTSNTCNNNTADGVFLTNSSNNMVTGNTCNDNGYKGIHLFSSNSNNTIAGNTCIRGTGLSTDYTASQHTIQLAGTGNNYNLIAMNNCMGKAVTNGGGTGNSVYGNKYDSGDYKDFTQDEKTKLAGIAAGANKYTHPANHPPSIITQDANNRFVTDAEKAAWSGKADKSYVNSAIEAAIGNAIATSY